MLSMKTKRERILSLILTMCMVLGMFAVIPFMTVSADDEPGEDVDIILSETDDTGDTNGTADAVIPETLTLTPGSDTSEIRLTWYSDRMDTDTAEVQFGGQPVSASTANATDGKSYHKATVTGLAPDTTYVYSVSNDGTNFSTEYTYKTPKTNEFTFVAVGDPQLTTGLQDATSNLFSSDRTTRMGWAETIAAMQQKLGDKINFIAGVGDQVDLTNVPTDNPGTIATSEQEYRNFLEPEFLRSIPIAPAVGNHDRHYGFTYHYNIPNEQAFASLQGADYGNATNSQYADVEAAGNYYYKYNNALFVVLNDSSYPTSTAAAAVIIDRFEATLQAAIATSPNYEWIFVQHHKSTASVADHIADRDIQYYVEAGFEKLMDKYEVDFVLAGHDHVYSRSYPLKNGQRGDNQGGSEIVNPNGTIYMTFTTASGLKYYELFNAAGNLYVKDNMDYPYLVNGLQGSYEYMNGNLPLSNAKYLQAKKPAFTSINVTGDFVTFETYNIDDLNTPIDAFTVTKNAAGGNDGEKVLAGIEAASDKVTVGSTADFTVSLENMKDVSSVVITFTVTGNVLNNTVATPLNGFTVVGSTSDGIEWTDLGGSIYQGKIRLAQLGGTFSALNNTDILKLGFNAYNTGAASVSLESIKVIGVVNEQMIKLESGIKSGGKTAVINIIDVFSIYDINKDGVVDELDLAILALYCGSRSSDVGWETYFAVRDVRNDPIYAYLCDINGDGMIDMLDLLELLANFTE